MPHRWRAINALAQHRKGFPDLSEATAVPNSASLPLGRNKFYNFGGSMQQQATGQHHRTPTASATTTPAPRQTLQSPCAATQARAQVLAVEARL